MRARRVDEIPAWDDRTRRPLGKVAALLAKRVATKTELAELAVERDRRAEKIAAVQTLLRTQAGPDGVPLTEEHRARVSALLEGAQAEYDKVVSRHAQLAKLLQAIEREQSIRDRLAEDAKSRAERVDELRALLEVGVDEEGDVLSDRDREQLRAELTGLLDQRDRAVDEGRARTAARRPQDESQPTVTATSRTDGPSLR